MFKKAIEINPKEYDAYMESGAYYFLNGKYDEADKMLKRVPANDLKLRMLFHIYKKQGRNNLSEKYIRKSRRKKLEYYNSTTHNNYCKIKKITTQRGIQLVCAQYPVRSVEPLKRMLEPREGIIFVNNEVVFKKAIEKASYGEYFIDMFAGDYGHCTSRGNRLLAENIANVILKRCLNE